MDQSKLLQWKTKTKKKVALPHQSQKKWKAVRTKRQDHQCTVVENHRSQSLQKKKRKPKKKMPKNREMKKIIRRETTKEKPLQANKSKLKGKLTKL